MSGEEEIENYEKSGQRLRPPTRRVEPVVCRGIFEVHPPSYTWNLQLTGA